MKAQNKMILLLLSLLTFVALTGCGLSAEAAENNLLKEAAAWFEGQNSQYEIICGEARDDTVVFLTGTKNPGTDSYQLLQAFILQKSDDGYAAAAMKDGERSKSAGISAHVLTWKGLTVVFGDTGDSVYDFVNDRRLEVDFTQVNILLEDDKTETRAVSGGAPYLLVFDQELKISDLEFVSSDLTVRYSSFYDPVQTPRGGV